MGRDISATQELPCIATARAQFFDHDIHPTQQLLARPLLDSWRRCQAAGLDHHARHEIDSVGRSQLLIARDRSAALLDNASSVMEHLFEHIRASGSMVLLADDKGMILHSLGDPNFVSKAQRVALQPGAIWSEHRRGTNAIGTAIIEAAAIEVLGAEHFLDQHHILNCSAAPIFTPAGQLAGVLDISTDSHSDQRHTLGLVRLATELVEKRLFEIEYSQQLVLAVHNRPECIGGPQEALLAIDGDGQIIAASKAARSLLDSGSHEGRSIEFSRLFRLSFSHFIDRCRRDPHAVHSLELRSGELLHARLRSHRLLLTPNRVEQRAQPTAKVSDPSPSRQRREVITLDRLATGDPKLQLSLNRAARISGKNIPLLIQGESGVGKELFARAFHFSGSRKDGPFVALNCAAIPENLVEAELFGYAGGAFTGARREGALGKIQQADGGTLFLDEIGDMPLGMQARLLRVLQERCVTPLGAQHPVPVNISLVCATHRQLHAAVQAGLFRADLYYRVNGLSVTLPPLRERSDLIVIATSLLHKELADSSEPKHASFSPQVLEFIRRYPWPGNIRQLHNVIRVATAMLDEDEDEIRPHHLPEELFAADPMDERKPTSSVTPAVAAVLDLTTTPAAGNTSTPQRSLATIELEAIQAVLDSVSGNISAAARQLGISRNTLYRRLSSIRPAAQTAAALQNR